MLHSGLISIILNSTITVHLNKAVAWLCLFFAENYKKITLEEWLGLLSFWKSVFKCKGIKYTECETFLSTLFNFQTTMFILIRYTRADNKSILNTISGWPQAVKDLSSVRLFLLSSLFSITPLLLQTAYWMQRFFWQIRIRWGVLNHLRGTSIRYILTCLPSPFTLKIIVTLGTAMSSFCSISSSLNKAKIQFSTRIISSLTKTV